jgi:hypothetical protein
VKYVFLICVWFVPSDGIISTAYTLDITIDIL